MYLFVKRLFAYFRPPQPVPEDLKTLFFHFYMDVVWYGILGGSTVAFIGVYATRLGASNEQIGMLNAVPALVNLVFSLPAGSWLSHGSLGKNVFWSSVFQRIFYLLLVPLPVILLRGTQVWVILLITFIMTIPGTAVIVGFNSMFGEVVPMEWRGYVVGIRNALMAIVSTVFTLISGYILNHLAFPLGYQVVFTLGFIGAGLSSLHLFFLSRIVRVKANTLVAQAQPRTIAGRKLETEIREMYRRSIQSLRLDAMRGSFARVMGLVFGWHLVQFMTIPVVTLFIVNQLHLSDQVIGLAGGLFNITTFIGSLVMNRLAMRFSFKTVTAVGIMGLSTFPILTSFGLSSYILANILCGLAWAMVGGALYNYLLENMPAGDRPAHLAWYSLVSNGAILLGSLAGPAIAGRIGFGTALVVFGIGRFLAGAAILRWG